MNTHYQPGQHVFFDGAAGSDKICATATTALSGHLVGIYTSIRSSSYTSVYGKVITATGAMPPSFLVPEVTDNYQKDADIAPIEGTDDFAVVWTSNATGKYLVYIRLFRVTANGKVVPVSLSQQLTENNGDYMAPRVVYLSEQKVYLVLWVSVTTREIQFKYVSYDETSDTFNDETYTTVLDDTVASDYFTSALDISNNASLSLCLINVATRVVAAIKRSASEIGLYEFTSPLAGKILQYKLPVYSVANISKFDICFDTDGYIKIVYVQTGTSQVYGDNIPYFGVKHLSQVAGEPVQLNQLNHGCGRPVIVAERFIAPPALSADATPVSYHVSWETASYGCFYNKFTADFIATGGEEYINSSDSSSDSPRLGVTDNQVAVLFNATKNGTVTLAGSEGILIDVYDIS
ncbi:hypothetical protein [Siccibacter turicensis]|uniref:hypothetical protein n=1 Tax=Siccibacter turicensis TaxID=357233 RepID=UPI0023F5847B|nr:hypothetical protein [Siccibacter turicensis]